VMDDRNHLLKDEQADRNASWVEARKCHVP
jgi:hypothetical protein